MVAVYFGIWFVSIAACVLVSNSRGRGAGPGLIAGVVASWLGLILILIFLKPAAAGHIKDRQGVSVAMPDSILLTNR